MLPHRDTTRPRWLGTMAAGGILLASMATAQELPPPVDFMGTFSPSDLAEARKHVYEFHCQARDTSAYCTDPALILRRERLIEAAAAAIARMPDISGRRDIQPKGFWAFSSNIVGCRDDRPCVARLLDEYTAAWNARNTAVDPDPVAAFYDPGYDCTTRQIEAKQVICRDPSLADKYRDMLDLVESVTKAVDTRQLAPEDRTVLADHYWHTTLYPCRNDKACISEQLDLGVGRINAVLAHGEEKMAELARQEAVAERQRHLAALAQSRREVAGNIEGILRDVSMPAISAQRSHSQARDEVRDERIAKLEAALADRAQREGRVYRALWFWSQFRNPKDMRIVFDGNRVPAPTNPDEVVYFHFGYPLARGTAAQVAILTAWVRTYDAHCGERLPNNPDTLRTEYLETNGPYFRRMTRVTSTDVLRFQPGLMRPYVASRDAMRANQASQLQNNQWQMLGEIVRGGRSALAGMAGGTIEPYLYALDDFDRFFQLVGCDSPTARQMSQGIFLLADGASLPAETGDAAIAGAAWVSDRPQGAGEYRLHSELCWGYELAASHNACGCLVDLASSRMNAPTPLPVSLAYSEVNAAFQSASDVEQRVCRNPLSAVSGGLIP
ncbi:hypothetical protein R5M92_15245 [Halomonas sp. Bachu 37]|uniref:hypothetical protein n=1 Tax=Halomonas kashgarensis TaxID=3084920 RepID=UPI00321646E0